MAQTKAPPFTLYEHRHSPYCVAVRIALNECEQTFTPREVDLTKPRTAAFLKRSPFGRLPALVEHRPGGELAVFESSAILLFLAERFDKSPMGFSDLPSKAQALSWLSFIATGLSESMYAALAGDAKAVETLEQQLDVLDDHLARRAYLAGDYSIADTLATPVLDLLERITGIDLDAFPHVISWRQRLRGRNSYKGVWASESEPK